MPAADVAADIDRAAGPSVRRSVGRSSDVRPSLASFVAPASSGVGGASGDGVAAATAGTLPPVNLDIVPATPDRRGDRISAALALLPARDLGIPAGLLAMLVLYLAGHRLLDRGGLPMSDADARGNDVQLVL